MPQQLTTFVDAFRRTADQSGEHGVRFFTTPTDSTRLTYADLDSQSRARAAAITAAGHQSGDVALLAFNAGINVVRAIGAALYAGLIIAPIALTPSSPVEVSVERMLVILRHSGSRLILTDRATWETLAAAAGDRLADVDIRFIDDAQTFDSGQWREPGITAESVAVLQYTSGSTGAPKGVVVTHGNLVANQSVIGTALHSTPQSIGAGWLPHYHDMGLIGLLLHPIYQGSEVVLTSPVQFLKRPAFWLRMLSDHKATMTVAPDFAYAMCARLVTDDVVAELDLSNLAIAITGAEPVRAKTLDAFARRFEPAGFTRDAFVPAYGMAETTLLVSGYRAGGAPRIIQADRAALGVGDFVEAPADQDPLTTVATVSCGQVAEQHAVTLVDPETEAILKPGKIGELWVSGPSVAQGYWHDAESTERDFGATLPGMPGVRHLRTGDLGTLIDGELVITGRMKDLIVVRGRNLYPQDIEERVADIHPALGSGLRAAFSHGDDSAGVGLAVEIEPRAVAGLDVAAALDALRAALIREFGLPTLDIVAVRRGTLPRTTSGKVRRAEVRRLFEHGSLSVFEDPASP